MTYPATSSPLTYDQYHEARKDYEQHRRVQLAIQAAEFIATTGIGVYNLAAAGDAYGTKEWGEYAAGLVGSSTQRALNMYQTYYNDPLPRLDPDAYPWLQEASGFYMPPGSGVVQGGQAPAYSTGGGGNSSLLILVLLGLVVLK